MNMKAKKLTTLALLCAAAYILVVLIRIPVVMFLKYEPKDVIITMAGFMMGPMASFVISLLVSLVEMMTISETGIIGFVMNVLSSCSFACVASFIYKKKHTRAGAVIGLFSGTAVMTAVMLLWNYYLTPLYMGYSRDAVAKMLLPAFLPFNLLKGGINIAVVLIVYKPIVTALRRAGLLELGSTAAKSRNTGMILVGSALLATCILAVLLMQGII